MRISDWSSDVCSSDLCRAVPQGRHRAKPVLHLVEGVHGSGQAPPGGRHCPCRDHRRGAGSVPRSACTEGMRGRPDTRKPSAEKKNDRGWGRRRMRYHAYEKLEINRIVEKTHTPDTRNMDNTGNPR